MSKSKDILTPFGWLYGKIANFRNTLYDKGIFGSHSLGARTISIGNITTGGTGKTPLVAFVAEILAERGEKVCILTRGYGRDKSRARVLVSDSNNILVDARTGGDEPVELAKKLLGNAIVIADSNRVSAAKWALEKFEITAFVLDDGFQHRRAKRDLDIVCVDATNPLGGGLMLPAGILREPVENLRRTDAVVVTRANLVDHADDIAIAIRKHNISCSIFLSENGVWELKTLEEFYANTQGTQDEKEIERSMAFCALGNPENFFEMLRQDGFDLAKTKAFPDHHFYKQQDIDGLAKQAKAFEVNALMTTAKDAVKLNDLKFEIPCYVVEIKPLISDADEFREMISAS